MTLCAIIAAITYSLTSPYGGTTTTSWATKSDAAKSVPKRQDVAFLCEAAMQLSHFRDIGTGGGLYAWESYLGDTFDYLPMKRSPLSTAGSLIYNATAPRSNAYNYSTDSDWVVSGCSVNSSAEADSLSFPAVLKNTFLTGWANPSWSGLDYSPDRCNQIASTNTFPNKSDLLCLFNTANKMAGSDNKLMFWGSPSGLRMSCANGRILLKGNDVYYNQYASTSSSGGNSDITPITPSVIAQTNGFTSSYFTLGSCAVSFGYDREWGAESSGHMVGETVNTRQTWISQYVDGDYRWVEAEGDAGLEVSLWKTNISVSATIDAYALVYYWCSDCDSLGWISGTRSLAAWNCTDYDVNNDGSLTYYKYVCVPITLTLTGAGEAGSLHEGRWKYRVSNLPSTVDFNFLLHDKFGLNNVSVAMNRTSYLSWTEWKALGIPYDASEVIPNTTKISTDATFASELEQYQHWFFQAGASLYYIFGFATPSLSYKW